MNGKINKIKNLRLYLLREIDGLSVQQLNKIPAGYNNNIIWNLGNLICAQQTVCYVRSGLPLTVEEKYITPFMPGTRPEKAFDEQEIQYIKEIFITSIDRLQADLDDNAFTNYTPSVFIPKVYGFEVINIEEALEYLLYHEGIHSGYIAALKKLV